VAELSLGYRIPLDKNPEPRQCEKDLTSGIKSDIGLTGSALVCRLQVFWY